MSPLQSVKFWIVQHFSLTKDALHIYVALTLFFGAALAFKWPLRSWKPWVVVLAAALIGEAWDLRDSLVYHTPVNLWANWHDAWNTMFWPSVIVLLARFTGVFGWSATETTLLSSYDEIDAIIDKWVATLGTTLFSEWAARPARFFHVPGDPPFECFQISVDSPERGQVSVHARAIDTNDNTEGSLDQTWVGPVANTDVMIAAAVEEISAWKSRSRVELDPPAHH